MWAALAKADLLGISLPEADGGGGYGLIEACLIAEQIGRTVAPVPYLSCIVGAALPVAEFGYPAQRAAAPRGHRRHQHAERGAGGRGQLPPPPQAVPDGDGWRITGTKPFVVPADRAAAILVPTRTGDHGTTVFLVAPDAPGVSLARGGRQR